MATEEKESASENIASLRAAAVVIRVYFLGGGLKSAIYVVI
jgi:hypothetical protein